jgi:hypothetical protein
VSEKIAGLGTGEVEFGERGVYLLDEGRCLTALVFGGAYCSSPGYTPTKKNKRRKKGPNIAFEFTASPSEFHYPIAST